MAPTGRRTTRTVDVFAEIPKGSAPARGGVPRALARDALMERASARAPRAVGIIGAGAIGSAVATAIATGRAGRSSLAAILVRDPAKARALLPSGCLVTADPRSFMAAPSDLVVEAAGHDALRAHGEAVLHAGKDLMLVSVGALADDALWQRLLAAARERGRRIHIVSGAIGGLDAIGAAALAGLDQVEHVVGMAPPFTLSATPARLERAGPPLGADNGRVFGEQLGLGREGVQRVRDDEVLA